ncbi:MAG: ABC transporter ATP-binding protein [Clostridiaceae bacterium]|nr:ABC transporter ATP-binding protein [Clostridiaceae bacterium]
MSEQKNDARPAGPAGPGGPGRPGGPHGGMMMGKPEKLKDFKGTMRRLLHYVVMKKALIIAVFLISLLSAVVSIISTKLNGTIVDDFIDTGDILGLARILLILGGVYLVTAGASYLQNYLMITVSQTTSAKLRRDLFTAVQKLPLKFFDTRSSGDIMSRLTNDIDSISNTISQSLPQFFSGIITVLGTLVAMFFISPLLALVAILLTPLTIFSAKFIVGKTQPQFKRQTKELGTLNGYIEEHMSGQKIITLFGREERVKKEFSEINERLTKASTIAQSLSGTMGPINNMINHFNYLVICVVGAALFISPRFSISFGDIFAFTLYMKNFGRPINEMLNLFNTIQHALAGAERVFDIMNETPETDAPDSIELTDVRGDVEANDVCFSYVPGKPVLKHASFHVLPGQTYAIVGPTGAGKTTIISLLTRFYDLESGSLTIDGYDIMHVTRDSLRRSIGMVLQDTFLFSESVMENIRYGRPSATDEEVRYAAELANADHFIRQLANGYDTQLSDNGGNLSQGQRQLLAIARALLAEPHILILDEATSSIDTRTELAAQKAMLTLMKGRTSFIIAHRLSTIRNANCILVVRDGEIVERGTHDDLISRKGFYAELYESQFKTGMAI